MFILFLGESDGLCRVRQEGDALHAGLEARQLQLALGPVQDVEEEGFSFLRDAAPRGL